MKRLLLAISVCVMMANPVFGQVFWIEQGDAGELPGTAQIPMGSGPLSSIVGTRGPDADMYLIHIPNPAAGFEAKTWPNSAGDTQLWLFDTNGNGITFNDDDPSGQQGLLSAITGQFLPGPGDYYIGISSFDYDPLSADDDEIWNDTPFNEERAPDGPGAPGPLAGWGGPGGSPFFYQIDLIGVEFTPSNACPADLDGDGDVDAADLAELLSSWGPCVGCPADFDGDGDVDAADLADLLAAWGACL